MISHQYRIVNTFSINSKKISGAVSDRSGYAVRWKSLILSETGYTVGIDKRVNLYALFAQRALIHRQALIVSQISGMENGGNREAFTFLQAGEDAADPYRNSAVILQQLKGRLNGFAGGY